MTSHQEPFCACGRDLLRAAGLSCYRRAVHSRVSFGGLWEALLERDRNQRPVCGAGKRLPVPHRQPAVHDAAWLVTVCAGCHARLHPLTVPRRWVPELLAVFSGEQHLHTPRQLRLGWAR